MDTKEAIKFIDRRLCDSPEKDQIFNLLQCGEKFKRMWERLENEGKNYSHSYIATTKYLMDNIKQKYFPKPKSRWQRINDILEALNTVGVSPDRKELVGLLIELRDEELSD